MNSGPGPGGGGKPLPGPAGLMIGGLRGSSGKTIVTLGLIGAWKKRGLSVAAFKKGPDYIDAAWHSVATGMPCYSLDVFLMGADKVVRQFDEKAPERGVAVIEGNRGLFDGIDAKGSYSTAELAKLLGVPVLLVVEATKRTRTNAALVLGCQKLDPELNIAGVVLNQVAGERHRKVSTQAIEELTGIPVVGAVPRLRGLSARERHLGLVTPQETPDAELLVSRVVERIQEFLDLDRIGELSRSARPRGRRSISLSAPRLTGPPVRVGVIRDSAFPFYYPENLEALCRAGAELVWIRALDNRELPAIHALYLGGGFPETHAEALSGAGRFRSSLRAAVKGGLPVYAECGGAVYLGRRITFRGRTFSMAGVFPLDFVFCRKPQGHGYMNWVVDRENPFYEVGAELSGHEFHYTRAADWDDQKHETVCRVTRGVGFNGERDGLKKNNVLAFYGHVHALGCPEWAGGVVAAARRFCNQEANFLRASR